MKLDHAMVNMGDKTCHMKMERLIVMIDRYKVKVHGYCRTELLLNLSDNCLFRGFVGLDLSTWEFPTAGKVTIATLSREDLALVSNDRCNNVDRLHRRTAPNRS